MNRREVAKSLSLIGAAAVALAGDWAAVAGDWSSAADDWPSAAGEAAEDAGSLRAVIQDGRYCDARRFAEALGGERGARLTTVGDPITLWSRDCRPRLPRRGWRLAGLTTYSDFTLLRACAHECGGGTLYEGLHDFRRAHGIAHTVRAGRSGETLARALLEDDWTVSLAQALARVRLQALRGDERAIHLEGGRPASDHPGTLVSWIIGS